MNNAADRHEHALGDARGVAPLVLRVEDGAEKVPEGIARQADCDDPQKKRAERGVAFECRQRVARISDLPAPVDCRLQRQRTDQKVQNPLGEVAQACEPLDPVAGMTLDLLADPLGRVRGRADYHARRGGRL